MTLQDAIETHIQNSLDESSFGDPREVVDLGPVRVIRDAPGRKRDPRRQSIIISGVDPDKALAAIDKYEPLHWALSVIEPMSADHDQIKATYKSKGYRLLIRFPFFVRSLAKQLDVPHRFAIERVADLKLVDALSKAKGRKMHHERYQPGDTPIRMYAAVVEGKPRGWVTSCRATDKANWVSDLYVLEEHRGKKIGEQLLRRMLEEDKLYGVKNSVLLSSSDGANLYPRLGYEQIGLMQIFTPLRR